jgi:hypothetical protein
MARAKARNIPFQITIQQAWNLFVAQKGRCALSGVPIVLNPSTVSAGANTASLDRIDSSKGYTQDNLQWVHAQINFMKHSLLEEEFITWCRRVAQHQDTQGILLHNTPRASR